jgi:pyruvate formate lyase activating enzyme
MKEALHYQRLEKKAVHCHLCPTNCIIQPDNFGNCGARKNISGTLFSMVYGRPVSIAVDPIEKKPLYHFLPGSHSLSIGTLGCNLHCLHCQNYDISQAKAEDFDTKELLPQDIVKLAQEKNCKSISYTYNEPTIFFEYVIETAKLAKKQGIKNIMVTNGYINKEPLRELYPYIDAANIDLKSIDEKFYIDICKVKLKPVLEAIKEIKKLGTWIELTNLIIPGYNDKDKQIKKLVQWVKKTLGTKTPLHFSAFHPTYKMLDEVRTPDSTLIMAKDIAKKQGLKYVYLGNTSLDNGGTTFCPKCKKPVIERGWFQVITNKVKNSKCPYCQEKIDGVFAKPIKLNPKYLKYHK